MSVFAIDNKTINCFCTGDEDAKEADDADTADVEVDSSKGSATNSSVEDDDVIHSSRAHKSHSKHAVLSESDTDNEELRPKVSLSCITHQKMGFLTLLQYFINVYSYYFVMGYPMLCVIIVKHLFLTMVYNDVICLLFDRRRKRKIWSRCWLREKRNIWN